MKLPNFFLAGAPKAGTTSLYHYLAQHPQIYMSPIKEPTFFGAADLVSKDFFRRRQDRDRAALQSYLAGPQTRSAPFFITAWDDYLKLFQNVQDEIAIGEASAGYFTLPSAAGAIRAKVPDARLIFILRNPTERLFSWYVLNLRRDPDATFRAWFLKELNPAEDWWPAVDGGRYATHLQRFLASFPAKQIRTYVYEDYQRDAPSVLRDMFAFLGVEPGHPIDTSYRHNETVVPRFPILHRLRTRLFGSRRLAPWLPANLRQMLRRLYHHRRGDFTMDPGDRRMVIEYYRDEIERTAELIGRDLSTWLR